MRCPRGEEGDGEGKEADSDDEATHKSEPDGQANAMRASHAVILSCVYNRYHRSLLRFRYTFVSTHPGMSDEAPGRDSMHLLELTWYMKQGSQGTDDDPDNPLSRATNRLFKEDGQPFHRIAGFDHGVGHPILLLCNEKSP